MRKVGLAVVVVLGLASCGQPKFEPHVAGAMQAMRDGDYKRYDASKTAAQHEVDDGWQPGGDPCQLQARDFENAGALDVVELLDNETVFKFSEDMRFVYTANVAAGTASTIGNTFTPEPWKPLGSARKIVSAMDRSSPPTPLS